MGLNEITFPVPTEILTAGVVAPHGGFFSRFFSAGRCLQDERDFIRSKGLYLCDVRGGAGGPQSVDELREVVSRAREDH